MDTDWIHCSSCGRTRRGDDFIVNDGCCASCTMRHRQDMERSNDEVSELERGASLKRRELELRIRATLLEDRADALLDGETPVTDEAIDACEKIGGHLAGVLPDGGWAVVATDDGGAEFVMQRNSSNRRVTIVVAADGSDVSARLVDMKSEPRSSQVPSIENPEAFVEIAEWAYAS